MSLSLSNQSLVIRAVLRHISRQCSLSSNSCTNQSIMILDSRCQCSSQKGSLQIIRPSKSQSAHKRKIQLLSKRLRQTLLSAIERKYRNLLTKECHISFLEDPQTQSPSLLSKSHKLSRIRRRRIR